MVFDLRRYQSTALDNLRSALARKTRLVLLYSPTGSGKTEMGMAMIRGAVGKGKRVAFIANRVELIAQASRRFLAAGIPHGILQGQNTIALDSQVLICSIQTVAKRGLPRLPRGSGAHSCDRSPCKGQGCTNADLACQAGHFA
ncbi:DEAD/DEAH box helicase family protein [Zoogloea sp.]|uniref:DEAD/DEAH box helicase n=1 Tax=Zoogloea sp. TaxID=49181 RepID=UPI001415CF9A|nr:MAG: hypothetical protein F9K15_10515 [Zoogloea sp.]